MTEKKTIIDSHVHLDLIENHHPFRIQWLKENLCGIVSWAFCEGVDSVQQLERHLNAQAQCIHRNSAEGLGCHYLAGVHPRSIPPDLKPERIASLLKPHFENPLCSGIGEIGLETADTKEQEVFIAQLELGGSLLKNERIIGVHTPRANKPAVTENTLNILKRFPDLSSSLVIDHCTIKTISGVLNAGFWAGVTLSPVKTSWIEMKQIVFICSEKIERIMCNTDSGTSFFEDVVQFSRAGDLPEDIRERLFHRNAAKFFKIL